MGVALLACFVSLPLSAGEPTTSASSSRSARWTASKSSQGNASDHKRMVSSKFDAQVQPAGAAVPTPLEWKANAGSSEHAHNQRGNRSSGAGSKSRPATATSKKNPNAKRVSEGQDTSGNRLELAAYQIETPNLFNDNELPSDDLGNVPDTTTTPDETITTQEESSPEMLPSGPETEVEQPDGETIDLGNDPETIDPNGAPIEGNDAAEPSGDNTLPDEQPMQEVQPEDEVVAPEETDPRADEESAAPDDGAQDAQPDSTMEGAEAPLDTQDAQETETQEPRRFDEPDTFAPAEPDDEAMSAEEKALQDKEEAQAERQRQKALAERRARSCRDQEKYAKAFAQDLKSRPLSGLDVRDLASSSAPGKEGDQFPCNFPVEGVFASPRGACQTVFEWKASSMCHKPLYFEQVELERYGHTVPFVHAGIAHAHFFGQLPILPYKMGIYPPWECRYPLGYYRPGNCAPYLVPPFPLSPRGALVETGVVTGIVFATP